VASAASNTEGQLAKLVGGRTLERAPTAAVKVRSNEQEPNNTVLQANLAEKRRNFAAAIDPENDVDYFKFTYRDSKNRPDIVAMHLETSLQHCALLSAWIKRTNPICLAGKDPTRKEPTITPITVGQALEANIMDGSDQDWHRLSGVKSKTVTVHLENQSTTLRPMIRALNADKSVLQGGDQANVEGANFDYSFPVEPGKEYFVVVKSYEDSSAGKYKISTH